MAYNTKYTIEFNSIINEQYRIDVQQDNYNGNVINLIAGADPLVIEYNQEDYLYNPLRFAGATIQIVSDNYLLDLYSSNYQSNKVNIYRNNSLIFTGFLTPEIYQQENLGYNSLIELNAVSALSTLEYLQFSSDLAQISLLQLIKDALAACRGSYTSIFIPQVWDGANTLKNLAISSSNFVDEEDEIMTYKEILEQIALFYNLTITEKDGNIYFIDVDYIKGNNPNYYKFNSNMGNETLLTLDTSIQNISDADSTGDNDTLSVINSYSKVTVIDSNYEIDKNLLFKTFDWTTKLIWTTGTTYDNYYYNKDLYNDGNYEFYQYTLSNGTFVSTPINSINPQANAGTSFMKVNKYDVNNRPNSLTYEDLLQVKLFNANTIGDSTVTMTTQAESTLPILKYSMNKNVVFEKNQVLAIDFQIFYLSADDGFPIEERQSRDDKVHENYIPSYYTPVSLKIGNKYYTGNGNNWMYAKQIFPVQTQYKADNHFANNWRNVVDDNDFVYNVPDLRGKLVWFDEDMIGDLELTVYCPQQFPDITGFHYWHRYTFLKNFSIKSQKQNSVNGERTNKKSTVYTNIISNNYLNELDDIELKITSKNDSELSHSKLINTNGNNVLDTIQSYYQTDLVKPEHLIINKITNQYQNIKIKIEEETKKNINPYQLINILSYPNKDFILTSERINYKYNSSQIIMIEVV